jgi:hypothetical protein
MRINEHRLDTAKARFDIFSSVCGLYRTERIQDAAGGYERKDAGDRLFKTTVRIIGEPLESIFQFRSGRLRNAVGELGKLTPILG